MARGDQLSRQWKIIQSLTATGSGKTATALANELECHSRTIYRDLEALQTAGFPLYTQSRDGKTHWCMIDGGKRQMPLPLSLTELMALYFSRNMLKVLQGTAIHESLNDLFEKVKATLSPQHLAYLEKIEQSLEVGIKSRKSYQHLRQILQTLQEAVQNRRFIEIEYFTMSRRRHTRRHVAPYKIWYYDETFYLIGDCRLRGDIRVFAVDRIRSIDVLETLFEIPPDFNADLFMQPSFGVFRGQPVSIRIHFAAHTAGYIREKVWHPSQQIEPLSDGSLIFRAQVAGIEEIKFWILRWGASARVLEPEELRRAVAAEARAMAAANAQTTESASST